MRTYKNAVKEYLRDYLKAFRKELNISQEAMSERLKLTPRSYSDLERGVSCLSTVTLLLLFDQMRAEDIIGLIDKLVELICEAERDDNAA